MRSSKFTFVGRVCRLHWGDHWNLYFDHTRLLEVNEENFPGMKKIGLMDGDHVEVTIRVTSRALPEPEPNK